MGLHVAVYRYVSMGGEVSLEDGDMGSCPIVSSRAVSTNELRLRAAKKLRALADKLDADAKRPTPPDGLVETFGPTAS